MQYQQALREWGAAKLREQMTARTEFDRVHGLSRLADQADDDEDSEAVEVGIDASEVSVVFEVTECWHTGNSMDESASTSVVISSWDTASSFHRVEIAAADFDFATVLGEIVAVADGMLTAS